MGRNYLCIEVKIEVHVLLHKNILIVGWLEDTAPIDFFFKIERLVCDQALTPKQILHFFQNVLKYKEMQPLSF